MKNLLSAFSLLLIASIFLAGTIDLNQLLDYTTEPIPDYITKDNTPLNNSITDAGATLGRVLFYDKNLSANQTVSCASCHQQAFAFGDTARLSLGLNGGRTGRHGMRLINSRFAEEVQFFWDERAVSLEDQTTRPIQDHIEMGYSGTNGDPDMDDLIDHLSDIGYYDHLFTLVFGDEQITEERMQMALAQFIRSIQSFDSRFDEGLEQVNNMGMNFPNFTQQENTGKRLFLTAPGNGGAGCQGCHRAPEFDIDPESRNNGIIGVAGDSLLTDLTNTRAPSLRDLVNPDGILNGQLMHDGSLTSLRAVIEHYNSVEVHPGNNNIDRRLAGQNRQGQQLNLTDNQMDALEAFLRTLTGENVYRDERWSDPFDDQGNLDLIPVITTSTTTVASVPSIQVYPNPTIGPVTVAPTDLAQLVTIYNSQGQRLGTHQLGASLLVDLSPYAAGIYVFEFSDEHHQPISYQKILKQ